MTDQIFFDGHKYISAADAADSSNVTRDYIARLCRDGKIRGKRVGKNWYVEEQSLKHFLVQQEYQKTIRAESLAKERAQEYQKHNPSYEGRPQPARAANSHAPASVASAAIVHVAPQAAAVSPMYNKLASAVAQQSGKMLEKASDFAASPSGVADAAIRLAHVPTYTVTPLAEFAHKLIALTLAVSITFGTYALVDPTAAKFITDTTNETAQNARTSVLALVQDSKARVASAAQDPAAYTASVGASIPNFFSSIARALNAKVDSLVYTIAFPQTLIGTAHDKLATVSLDIQPYARPGANDVQPALGGSSDASGSASAPASGSVGRNTAQGVVGTTKSTVVQRITQPVIERVITAGGITEDELASKLNELNNKLVSQMYAITSVPNSLPATGGFTNTIALTQRIDKLGSVDITGSTFKSGTISDTSVSANDLSVSGNTNLATTTVTGDLTVHGTLGVQNISLSSTTVTINGIAGQTTNFLDIRNASGTTVFAVQPDGTLISNTASTTQSVSQLLITGNATATNMVILNTASTTNLLTQNATSTNFFAVNASTTNATSTNLFATLANFTTSVVGTLSATVANITGLTVTNSTTTNATTTNFFAQNASTTNATSTNLFANSAHFIAGVIDSLTAAVASITNLTATNLFATNASSTNATTTNLAVTNLTSFASPIAPYFTATSSTASQFPYASSTAITVSGTSFLNGGFLALASSTIGDGNQNGGLTINGGATTTGDFVISKAGAPATGNLYFGSGTAHVNYNSSDYTFYGGSIYTNAGRIVSIGNNETIGLGVRNVNGDGTFYLGASHSFTPDLIFTNTGNTERARLTDAGYFGIGTTTPGAQLAVEGASLLGNSATAGYFTATSSTASTFAGGVLSLASSTFTGDTHFTANVGIGTASPQAPLDVVGNSYFRNTAGAVGSNDGVEIATDASAPRVSLVQGGRYVGLFSGDAPGNTYLKNVAGGSLLLYGGSGGNQELARLTNSGSFGIGTSSPFTKLGVAGDAYIGGNLTATGTLSVAGAVTLSNPSANTLLYANGSNQVASASVGSSLTFSGGSLSLNTANANTFSALQSFANATSTLFSATQKAYFGTTGQSSFDFNGALTLGTALAQGSGGTGITSYTAGDVLYANGSGNLTKLGVGSTGDVLTVQAGLPAWAAPSGGGGGGTGVSGGFATTTDDLVIYPTNSRVLTVGGSAATSSQNSIFEVHGQSYFSSLLGIATSSPATTLSVGGSGYFTGGLGVGVLNTSAGTLQTSGNATIGGTLLLPGLSTNSLLYNNGFNQVAAASTDSSLTFSGGTLSLNTSNANTFSALQAFNSGLTAYASSTIGNGNQNGGLTISGGATTTGNAYFAGNIGIATSSPGAALEVNGNILLSNNKSLQARNADGTIQSILTYGANNAITLQSGAAGSGQGGLNITAHNNTTYLTDGGWLKLSASNSGGFVTVNTGASALERVRFDQNGNVGIGTSSPYALLSLAATPSNVNASGALFTISSSTAAFATSTLFTLLNSGNVGIGTANPSRPLNIVGGNVGLRLDTTGASNSGLEIYQAGASKWSIYNPGSGSDLRFYDGTSDRLTLLNGGNVGVGTTSPASLFSVAGNGYFTGLLGLGTSNPIYSLDAQRATANARFLSTTATNAAYAYFNNTNGVYAGVENSAGGSLFTGSSPYAAIFGSTGAYPTQFSTNNNVRLTIDSGGNVGIGTTSPLTKLSVQGTAGANDVLNIASSTGASLLYVNAAGNVGIGNSSPTEAPLQFANSTQNKLVLYSNGPGLDYGFGLNSNNLSAFVPSGAHFSLRQNSYSGSEVFTTDYSGNGYFAGNVGIGTTTPAATLGVNGGAYFNGNINIAGQQITSDGVGASMRLTAGAGLFLNAGSTKFSVSNGTTCESSSLFCFASNGDFGIGTISPTSPLYVVGGSTFGGGNASIGSSGRTLSLGNNTETISADSAAGGTTYLVRESTGGLFLGAQGGGNIATTRIAANSTTIGPSASSLVINSSGNVGIGTTTIGAHLDVAAIGGSDNASIGLTNNSLNRWTLWNDNGSSGFNLQYNGSTRFSMTNAGSASFTGYQFFDGLRIKGTDTSNTIYQGNSNSNLYITANGGDLGLGQVSANPSLIVKASGNIGIGTTTPTASLQVVATGTIAPSLTWGAAAGQIFRNENSEFAFGLSNASPFPLWIQGRNSSNAARDISLQPLGGKIGIGTSTPQNALSVNGGIEVTGAATTPSGYPALYFGYSSSAGNIYSINNGTAWTPLTISGSKLVLNVDGSGNSTGNVGIGTSTPFRKLSVKDTVAAAQLAIAYDDTRYTELQTNSTGDYLIAPSGGNVRLNNQNLFVCSGGACPTGSPSGAGNLIVGTKIGIGSSTPQYPISIEAGSSVGGLFKNTGGTQSFIGFQNTGSASAAATRLGSDSQDLVFYTNTVESARLTSGGFFGVGTTSPAQKLSTAGLIFVGANGATGMGTATSTFYGDIKINGKLDVSTIDPVYTIDGLKYATYGDSTVGIHENVENTVELMPDADGTYSYAIDFDALAKGSDLWLFYQVTDFGHDWKQLVVSLTPGFDGSVHYEKVPGKHELRIVGTGAGEVSMKLSANRYDFAKWPNIRADQDGNTEGTHVISSKPVVEPAPEGQTSAAALSK